MVWDTVMEKLEFVMALDEWDKFQQMKNKKEKRKKNRMSGSI